MVGEIAHNPYAREPRRTLYVPFPQAPPLWMDIGVRTAGDPLALAPAVTAAVHAVDREQPITDLQSMARAIHNRAIGLNLMAVLMGVFGVLALCLSAIGVYGVMAYMVSEQTHEIGIRVALDAERQNVLAMVFRRGMMTIGAGLAVGLPIAWWFARLMASLIFGVTANDAATFVTIPLALIAAARWRSTSRPGEPPETARLWRFATSNVLPGRSWGRVGHALSPAPLHHLWWAAGRGLPDARGSDSDAAHLGMDGERQGSGLLQTFSTLAACQR